MASRRVLGIDGCPAGWVAVSLVDGRVDEVEVVEHLAEVLTGVRWDSVAVDMPVGLLDGPRDADRAARALLPGRASSVFSAPLHTVVVGWREGRISTHAEATAAAVAATGAGMSQQAWRLVPKVAEVDGLVADGVDLRECHPELAFALLAGGDPLPRKRSWGGATSRRRLLERLGLALPDRFAGDDLAAVDDVLDAAVCAWVADGQAAGEPGVTVPHETDQRAHGRPVVIHARRPPDPSDLSRRGT